MPFDDHYNLGDTVRWLKERDGRVIEPFAIRQDGDGRLRWNCGGPGYPNVIALDIDLALRNTQVVCPNCKTEIAEVIALLNGGKFRELRALDAVAADRLLGPSAGKTKLIIVREDGTHWPREDWFDVGLTFIDGAEVEVV